MNVGGLSNATFMGGLMQGAQFVEGMQNRSKANDRADAQAARQQELHDQTTKLNGLKINEAELKANKEKARLMTRRMRETNSMPTNEELKELKPFGIDKFASPDFIEESQNAGALIHKAMETGEWGEQEIGALGTTFYDENRAREKKDGLKRRPINVQKIGDDKFIIINEITDKDGNKYNAPITKEGTANEDDNLVTFNQEKINQIHEVQMQRANMAYLWEKSKNDPKKAADLLDNIIFGKPEQEYTIKDVRDENGQSRMARFDKNKNFVNWVGGSEPFKDSKGRLVRRGRGGSGGGSVADDYEYEDMDKILKEFRDGMATAETREEQDDFATRFYHTTGFNPTLYRQLADAKLAAGDKTPPTRQELIRASKANALGAQHVNVEEEIAENPNVFGTGKGKPALSDAQMEIQESNDEFWQQEGVEQPVQVQQDGAAPPPVAGLGDASQAITSTNVNPSNNPNAQPEQDSIQMLEQVSEKLRNYSPITGNIPKAEADQLIQQRTQLEQQAEAEREKFKEPIRKQIEQLLSVSPDSQVGLLDVDSPAAIRNLKMKKPTAESKKIQQLKRAMYAIDNAKSHAEIQEIVSGVIVDGVDKQQDGTKTF